MNRFNKLTPVAHTVLEQCVRVPMCVSDGVYTLCVGDDAYRMFDDETLPDKIKSLLGMIKAFPPNDLGKYGTTLAFEAYLNQQDPRLNDVGWRVTEGLYMLILTYEFLEELRGGDHGVNAGSKSKTTSG